VLDELDISVENVRTQIQNKVGKGETATTGQIPFTPRAKRTLELALREAVALGHNYIGTEHVLLGLIREAGGVASEILRELGADSDGIRNAVVAALGGPAVVQAAGGARGGAVLFRSRPRHLRAVPWPHQESLPRARRSGQVEMVLLGWALFALALGAGILIGWAIWG
jgi:ATP-dependent Clp protease ATP-binding subunit ClpA